MTRRNDYRMDLTQDPMEVATKLTAWILIIVAVLVIAGAYYGGLL